MFSQTLPVEKPVFGLKVTNAKFSGAVAHEVKATSATFFYFPLGNTGVTTTPSSSIINNHKKFIKKLRDFQFFLLINVERKS